MCETSEKLKALVEKARTHVMTPAERFEQRVSLIYGLSDGNTFTKNEIREKLITHQGIPSEETK
jgi:hypothetical protein